MAEEKKKKEKRYLTDEEFKKIYDEVMTEQGKELDELFDTPDPMIDKFVEESMAAKTIEEKKKISEKYGFGDYFGIAK